MLRAVLTPPTLIASNYCQCKPVNGNAPGYVRMPNGHTMGCFIALSPNDIIVVASDQWAQ